MDVEDYDEALENASGVLADAMHEDLESLIEEGHQLDWQVKEVAFAFARKLLSQLYALVRARLVDHYKEEGLTVERRKVVTFKPIVGPIEVESPYMYDRQTGRSARPMREAFGIVGDAYSAGADRALSDFGAESSFEQASERFAEHYGWTPGASTARSRTQDVAEAAEAYVESRLEEASDIYGAPEAERARRADEMLIEADGCHIRCGEWMSAREARRRCRQFDDDAQLKRLADYDEDDRVRLMGWKEVRTGLVRRFGEVEPTYICRRAPWESIARKLFEAACSHGLTFETQVVAVGDGGNGLKESLEMEFPRLQFILDWSHLEHHFYQTGERLLEEGHLVGEVSDWVDGFLDRIYEEDTQAIIADLESLKSTLAPPNEPEAPPDEPPDTAYGRLERLIKYLTRFYQCLDYQTYQQRDWPIGSGEVESAHQTVPQRRLKLPGATWNEENLSKMCALRVVQTNGWWDDFWDQEFTRRQAA